MTCKPGSTFFALSFLLFAVWPAHVVVQSQAAASAPKEESTVTGCVMESAKSKGEYLLASEQGCFLLRGSFTPEGIANHEVVLKGTMLDPEGLLPLRFQVRSTGRWVEPVRAFAYRSRPVRAA